MTMIRKHQKGLTYLELVIGIIIIGIAVSGVLKTIDATMFGAMDPLQQTQALAIAESYLEEILAKPYYDPVTGEICPTPPGQRSLYDNVCDYNGLSNVGAQDQDGNPIIGLQNYNVNVTVATNVYQQIVYFSPSYTNVNTTTPALEVNVVVSFNNNKSSIALSGYRLSY